jgi:hypothetical protein
MKITRLLVLLFMSVSLPADAQVAINLGESFLYVPAGTDDSITATHVKVPGLGNYDVRFKFNPNTLSLDLQSATPSSTDDNTESLTGLYHCKRYGESTPLFSTYLRPAGRDMIFGGGIEYRFNGNIGSNAWQYIVPLSDGGRYLLHIVKESASSIYALTGSGQDSLDLTTGLRCDKSS